MKACLLLLYLLLLLATTLVAQAQDCLFSAGAMYYDLAPLLTTYNATYGYGVVTNGRVRSEQFVVNL